MLRFLDIVYQSFGIAFAILYSYHILYLLIGLFRKSKKYPEPKRLHRYGAIIAARNEEVVIADLIASIRAQDYPQELLDIYVIADNCTDSTAAVSRKAGATVFERFNKAQVGKGYALDFLFKKIFERKGERYYDAFFVFDADNIVDPQFVREMNRVFDTGEYVALTSYRNSKNYCDNWLSAGYSLWFLREARYLNNPRSQLGLNCPISGTGFLISTEVLLEQGGWTHHLLTEDIEFSIDSAIHGRKIGYCATAVVYDEQPTTLKQSWYQRLRWSRGFLQITGKYSSGLARGLAASPRHALSCYDMLMTVAPTGLITIVMLLIALVAAACSLFQPQFIMVRVFRMVFRLLWITFRAMYGNLLLLGGFTLLTEWKNIKGPALKKLLYLPLFPLYVLSYLPISVAALFGTVEWKPIQHGATKQKSPVL